MHLACSRWSPACCKRFFDGLRAIGPSQLTRLGAYSNRTAASSVYWRFRPATGAFGGLAPRTARVYPARAWCRLPRFECFLYCAGAVRSCSTAAGGAYAYGLFSSRWLVLRLLFLFFRLATTTGNCAGTFGVFAPVATQFQRLAHEFGKHWRAKSASS